MNTIFCPTDFTEESVKAATIAFNIANLVQGKLILMHAYHVTGTEAGMKMDAEITDRLKIEAERRLDEMIVMLRRSNPSAEVTFEKAVRYGFAVDEIIDYSKISNADLIVLNTKGIHGFAERVAGSIAGNVLESTNIPVLILPKETRLDDFKKIVFASELKAGEENLVDFIISFARLFGSEVTILHVKSKITDEDHKKAINYVAESNMSNKDYEAVSIDLIEENDLEDGINRYAEENQADLIVMARGKRGFWASLFQSGNTKKMASHTRLPLLALHKV